MKNMKRKNSKLIFVLSLISITLLFLAVHINNVMALGITPGRVTLEFEPGAEKIVSFNIVNTEHKAMNLSINVEGEWASYTALSQNHVEFNPSDEIKTLSYKFRMPSKIDSSGIKARVIAFESKSGNGTINTIVAVEQQLYIIYSASTEEQQPQEKERGTQPSVQEANQTVNETKQNESAERGKILFIFENTQTNKIAVLVAAALVIALIILVLIYLIRRFRKHARERKK